MRTHSQILLAVLLALFLAACVRSASYAEATWCTFICGPAPSATPSPSPSPTPTPTPSPTPTPTPDFVVAPSGGTHTSIGAAYSAASCGDLIVVRNGTYTLTSSLALSKNCSSGNPLTISNYSGESPKVTCSNPATDAKRVNMTGPYHTWDGIEIYGCYNGINIHASNVKVLNSKIHNNLLFGIITVTDQGELTNIEIAGNTVEVNGYIETADCTVGVKTDCDPHVAPWNPAENVSPKNSHGVYLSDGSNCNGLNGVHVHHNLLRHAGGRGLQMNGSECIGTSVIQNVLVEENTFENNSWGISLFYGVTDIEISNNDFVMNSWPATNDTDHTFIGLWAVENSVITNNTFTSGSSSVEPLRFYEDSGCPENDIDLNTWDVNSNNWLWNGSGRSDFGSNYESVSGCGANDVIN